jgi:hypothetical protein
MILFRRRLLAALLGGCALAARGGEIRLPPIAGQLSGQLTPLKIAGAPPVHWTVNVRPPAEGGNDSRDVEAVFEGPGTRVKVVANFTTTEDGTWKIIEGEVGLSIWFPVAAGIVGETLQGITATGSVKISGEGSVRAGEPAGTLRISVASGRVQSRDGWALDQVGFTGSFAFEMPALRVKSTDEFQLKVDAVTTNRFGARNIFVRGALNEDRSVALREASVEIAGGKMTLDPTTVKLAPVFVETTLRIVSVGLQDVAALVPSGLSESHGRIDGAVGVGWKEGDGFVLGAGELNLNPAEPATARLAPTPGFLTRSMPKRFGPFANPVYPDLEEIEMGRVLLQVQTLTIRLTPEGDERGRTGSVHMAARPVKAKAGVKVLNFDVNVAGPITDVINLGLKQKDSVSIQAR